MGRVEVDPVRRRELEDGKVKIELVYAGEERHPTKKSSCRYRRSTAPA